MLFSELVLQNAYTDVYSILAGDVPPEKKETRIKRKNTSKFKDEKLERAVDNALHLLKTAKPGKSCLKNVKKRQDSKVQIQECNIVIEIENSAKKSKTDPELKIHTW